MKFLVTALRNVSVLADGVGVRMAEGQRREIEHLERVFFQGKDPILLPLMPKKIGDECQVDDALLVRRIK